jgi:hypothetical protein
MCSIDGLVYSVFQDCDGRFISLYGEHFELKLMALFVANLLCDQLEFALTHSSDCG